MKTIYTINITDSTSSTSIFSEFNSEEEARVFFEKKKREILPEKPADTTDWTDNDLAWGNVYRIELVKLTFDADGDIEEIETVESSDYYYR